MSGAGVVAALIIFALIRPGATAADSGLPPPPDLHGGVDCDDDVDSVDALAALRHVAGFPVRQHEPCVPVGDRVADGIWIRVWGDVDCDDAVDTFDAELILRYVAGLAPEPSHPAFASIGTPTPTPVIGSAWSCPPIGWDFGE